MKKTPDKMKHQNINKDERIALMDLRNNRDIIIKSADIGGTIVIQDLDKHMTEAYRQLNDEQTCKKTSRGSYQEDKRQHNPTFEEVTHVTTLVHHVT